MKRYSILIPVAFLGLLGGCFQKQHVLHFSDKRSFNVNEKVDACRLVEGVDALEVYQGNIHDGRILINDLVISCPEIDTSELGEQTVYYRIGDKEFPLEIAVEDKEAPKLIFSSRNVEVDQYDSSFNILKLVEAADNVDKDVIVGIASGFDINKSGEYIVRLQAIDDAGNIAYDEIRINVMPREKPEPEKEIVYVEVPSPLPEVSGSKNPSGTLIDRPVEEKEEQQQETVPKPDDRTYLFGSYGGDDPYAEAYSICMEYGRRKLADGYKGSFSCDAIYDGNEPTGYKCTFK